ncbi:MAG: hypothetical protein BIFFINMI_01054 [Phycisphaerae bacterium]|nr:hypothetical protein [Phycisphaerae bacterium]
MHRLLILVMIAIAAAAAGCGKDKARTPDSPADQPASPPQPSPTAGAPGAVDAAGHSPQWTKVRAAIDGGADLNAPDDLGFAPADDAAMNGAADAIELLAERGADLNRGDAQTGWTPLHWAASRRDVAMVKLLLSKGAKPDATDARGRAPLHAAVDAGDPESAAALLEAGAEVSRPDSYGATPLHAAVRAGSAEMVDWLLARGATRDAKDAAGRTPADLARLLRNAPLAERLTKP